MPNKFRPKFTNSVLFLLLATVSLTYWIADRYVPTYDFNDLLDGPLILTAFAVATLYSAGLVREFNAPTSQIYIIKLGIALSWFATGVWRISRFLYAEGVFGKASIGIHDSWRGYMIALSVLAGLFHIIAIDINENAEVSKSYVYMCVALISLGVVGVGLFKIFATPFLLSF